MPERNKEIVARYLDELHNKGNYAIGDELVGTDYAQNNPHVKKQGMSGSAQSVQRLRDGFPDYRLVIEHQVAEGDTVVSWGRFEGTHTGNYRGVPPTGKPIKFSAMFIHRLEHGRIAETWNGSDRLHLLQQLGAVSLPD